jgi:hypothetical protein
MNIALKHLTENYKRIALFKDAGGAIEKTKRAEEPLPTQDQPSSQAVPFAHAGQQP